MKWVVDASVFVKWYVPEVLSDKAARLLSAGEPFLAPDLLAAEAANTLWKKCRRGELTREEVFQILQHLTGDCPVSLHPSPPLLQGAMEIATAHDRSVYDALYIALAVVEEAVFVTADEKAVNALRATPLEPFVRWLGDL